MKGYEKIMGIGSMDLNGFSELPGSSFVTVESKIYVPEKKIVLLDSLAAEESRCFMSMTKGGFIV